MNKFMICSDAHCQDYTDLPSEVIQNCNDELECMNNVKDYCDDNKSECGEWSKVQGISYQPNDKEQRLKICKSQEPLYIEPGWITLLKIGIHKIFYNYFLT